MKIQFVIINFLILAAIILLFFGKKIIAGFRDRRQAILRDLDEAEELDKLEAPVFKEPVFEPDAAMLSGIGDGIGKINQAIPGYFGPGNLRDLTGIEADS